uniref:Uncharacterized protein n=1 Tax=Melon chlorotic spot virus TaxID=2479459 RepID=A0A481T157_9VIRU|nr:hypothetical protein [Melon chlorotic spot virus]
MGNCILALLYFNVLKSSLAFCDVAGYITNTHWDHHKEIEGAIVDLEFRRLGDSYCMKDFNLTYVDVDIQTESQGHVGLYRPKHSVKKEILCAEDMGFSSAKVGEEVIVTANKVEITKTELDTGIYSCFPQFYHAKSIMTITIDMIKIQDIYLINSFYLQPILDMSLNGSYRILNPISEAIYATKDVIIQKMDSPTSTHLSIYSYFQDGFYYGITDNLLTQATGTCAWFISINHHLLLNDFQVDCIKRGLTSLTGSEPKLEKLSRYDVIPEMETTIRLVMPAYRKSVVSINDGKQRCSCEYQESGGSYQLEVVGFTEFYTCGNQIYHNGTVKTLYEPKFILCNGLTISCSTSNISSSTFMTERISLMRSYIHVNDLKFFFMNHLWLTSITIGVTILILKKL